MSNWSFIPSQTWPFIHDSLSNSFKWSSPNRCEGQSRPLLPSEDELFYKQGFIDNTSVKEAYKLHTSTLKSISAHYFTTSEMQNKTY